MPTAAANTVATATTTPTASATATAASAATTESTPATTAEPTPAAATVSTATLPAIDPALALALQRVLDATVADGTIPGAVLSVTIPGYQPWSAASGLADPQQQVAMQPHTPVRIGSLTKLFTAVVVLQLAEDGALELDTPISTWLPGLLEQGDTITVRQLLDHTTGLYDYLEDRSFVEQAYAEAERDPQLSTVLGHIGGFGGFRAALWHVPAGGITIALGVNQGAVDPNTVATTGLDTILAYQGR